MGFRVRCASAALAVICLSAFVSLPAGAQVVIRGTLYHDSTGLPVRGTMMLVDPATNAAVVHVVTDSLGLFELRAPSGIYQIAAVRDGFVSTLSAPIGMISGERMTVRVPIATGNTTHHIGVTEHIRPVSSARAQEVPSQAVPSQETPSPMLSDFARRTASQAPGHRYDRRSLDSAGIATLGEFLQRLPGVSVVDPSRGASLQMSRSAVFGDASTTIGSPCHVGWFVDNHRMDFAEGVDAATSALAGMPLETIEAIEIFRGLSEMPAELAKPELRCGAIVIWTRRGL